MFLISTKGIPLKMTHENLNLLKSIIPTTVKQILIARLLIMILQTLINYDRNNNIGNVFGQLQVRDCVEGARFTFCSAAEN
ncbi:hypothetical protein Avbf_04864 [Armadillidium vulgare]|nr:hypothetical protein Avbf_04864 [Armadillidium vulgare]